MSSKLKVGALVFVVLGVATLLLLQQQQIRRLGAENTDLRAQLSQIVSLQDTNGRLAEQLTAAAETAQVNQHELLRLRGQVVRLRQLEQENAQLKSQRQQLDRQMQQTQFAAVSSKPGEVTAASDVSLCRLWPRGVFSEAATGLVITLRSIKNAANRPPALRATVMDNLNIDFASHAPGPAVAELAGSATPLRV